MLSHGGRVLAASRRYGIEPEQWLDLSTGVSPWSWLEDSGFAPSLKSWARLPEDNDDLLACASNYYGAPALPAAGSQAAIQVLPGLRSQCCVGVVSPTYAEHAEQWQRAGHRVERVPATDVDDALPQLDVLALCNPNNPDGLLMPRERLLAYRDGLAARGGWLVVDEAFADAAPEHSLARDSHLPGLIVLRSLGKFFGLAGTRVGFVLCEDNLRAQLREALGPWPVSGPAREVTMHALRDQNWHSQQARRLQAGRLRLAALLTEQGLSPDGGNALFQFLRYEFARDLKHHLALQAILVRRFRNPESLRFGLPRFEQDWTRLQNALASYRRIAA